MTYRIGGCNIIGVQLDTRGGIRNWLVSCVFLEARCQHEEELLHPEGSLGWETDFYTPQVLGGAALFDNSAPAVYKNPVP